MKTQVIRQIKLFALLFGLVLLPYQNCSFGMKGLDQESSSAVVLANYKPSNLTKAVVSAAKTFANRLPTADELQKASTNVESYRAVITSYTEGAEFKAAMIREHQNYLKIGGSVAGSNIDFNVPARLGAYTVINDLDYSEVLKASYCVDANLQKTPFCDSFTSAGEANANAAGILTTRAYISTHKPKKAFNFRIVNDSFQKFNCSNYPDGADQPGMPNTEISSKLHPWGSTANNCYGCHKSINPKAYLFYFYANDGRFTGTNTNGNTRTDGNANSVLADIIVAGVQPRVQGQPMQSVKDLGNLLVADRRFGPCMVRRYVNFMLGKSYEEELPDGMTYLSEMFEASGNNVKKLLLEISTSAAYVNRGEMLQATGSRK